MTMLFSRFLFEIFPESWRTIRDHGRIHSVAQMGYFTFVLPSYLHTEVDDEESAGNISLRCVREKKTQVKRSNDSVDETHCVRNNL